MKRVPAKSGRVNSPEIAGNFDFDRRAGAQLSAGSAGRAIMDPKKAIELEGKIISVLAGTMFRVELANEHMVLAHISGKMRKRFIRLTTGDRVKLQMSPYDIDKARIVYRLG
jgi:translation initiation factor IF-1